MGACPLHGWILSSIPGFWPHPHPHPTVTPSLITWTSGPVAGVGSKENLGPETKGQQVGVLPVQEEGLVPEHGDKPPERGKGWGWGAGETGSETEMGVPIMAQQKRI